MCYDANVQMKTELIVYALIFYFTVKKLHLFYSLISKEVAC